MNPMFKLIYMIVITVIWMFCIMVIYKETLWQLAATFVAFFLLIPAFKREKNENTKP